MTLANRKYYAKEVSFSDISPQQRCWKCKDVIRDMDWWKATNKAYHYRSSVYCGGCLYKAWYPVKDENGGIYHLSKPTTPK